MFEEQNQPSLSDCQVEKSAAIASCHLGSLFLSWNKKIDKLSVWQEKMRRLFREGLYIFLGLLVLYGLAQGLLFFWKKSWQFNWEIITSAEIIPSWVAILAFSFLIYYILQKPQPQPVIGLDVEKGKIEISQSFRKETIEILYRSWQVARQYQLSEVNTFCLLLAIVERKKMAGIFARLSIIPAQVTKRVQSVISSQQSEKNKQPALSNLAYQALFAAYQQARISRTSWVGVPELLSGILKTDVRIQDIFYDLDISEEKMNQAVKWLAVNQRLLDRYHRYRQLARFKPKNSMNRAMTAVATPYLDRVSHDLTLAAKYGALELCVSRHQEIEEIFRVISAGASSVVLVGQAGVGKTTIIEGIAEKMVTEDVPDLLQDKRLVSLSLPRLIAGSSASGVLEKKVLRIHQEVARAGNVVLIIENIHDAFGLNTESGQGLDFSEVLADMIEDDRFLVITTSNPVDYRRSLAGKSLGSKLQKIEISEMDEKGTLEVLISKVNYFEYKYKIFFSLDALQNAIKLSERYMHDYYLPEKAIRILEEVAVWISQSRGTKSLVSGQDVAELVSKKVNIPLTNLTEDESVKLLHLEDSIHQRIVNQEEAVGAVASALRRARTNLRDQNRPIVNLLFLGPTGVGKTELAKTVAATYFGKNDDMVRLDMSEYQEKNSIGRLIGTADSPNDGLLTTGIRENPYTVLLLDEIEKAHPDILNIFLQVMDDGRLTDWSGRTIDFTNTIIISTSNAGTQFIQDQLTAGSNLSTIKTELVNKRLKEYFRPEFLNRFDNIVLFTPLSPDHIRQIAKLLLQKSQARLLQKGIHLEVSEEALTELAQAGFDPLFGARPMRRVIQERVEDALAKYLLAGKISRRDLAILQPGGKIRIEKAKQYV